MALTKFPFETDKPTVQVTLPVGRHILELVVEDSAGLVSAPDTVIITVQKQESALPVIKGIEPDTGFVGATFEAAILGENLGGATDVTFFTLGGIKLRPTAVEDPTIKAKVLDATDGKVGVTIQISPDAAEGPRGFKVETRGGAAESWENNVLFTAKLLIHPTILPTIGPTILPTLRPTIAPTVLPTIGPTILPTVLPTLRPTIGPTIEPTILPTIGPTILPTIRPTFRPLAISGRSMTEVRGIGPTLAARLEAAGVTDLGALAATAPEQIAQVLGVSEVRAMGFVDEARRLLPG